MKKVLITGGSGTVGSSFIREYYNEYDFYNISRNEAKASELKNNFPKIKNFINDICDLSSITNIFDKIKPDIVVHAAAMKHINLAEKNPTTAIEINVNGSLNIIKSSIRAKVPLTIGISTDKACNPDSIYGYTKKMMEEMFMHHHNIETKFVCSRFANVVNSNGSVVPYWKNEAKKGNALKLTHSGMNRLMFTKKEAAELINYTINFANHNPENSFIMCKIMKNVNLSRLAKIISNKDVEIIGIRPGEKLNETLISEKELPYTSVLGSSYVFISSKKQENNLEKEHSSLNAIWMNNEEMLRLISD
jgi:UDP-N-acetylglucosamine 4,6-dehydratase